jgi:hypothetical protein
MSLHGGLGSGRERGSGDERDRKAAARKPTDRLEKLYWTDEEPMRQILELLMGLANVGSLPALLSKKTGKPKPFDERFKAVHSWCTGLVGASQGNPNH